MSISRSLDEAAASPHQTARAAVARPGSGRVMEIIFSAAPSFALFVAHQRGLFRLLDGSRLTLTEICEALGLKPRAVQALLSSAAALGLLEVTDSRWRLSKLAEDFLVASSPTYMGFLIDLTAGGTWEIGLVDAAVATDRLQRPDMDFANLEGQADQARAFTRAMHSVSFAPALVWPDLLDLSDVRLLLDIAGGSGAHAIGACLRWPKLRAVVLDMPPVCAVADEFVADHRLAERITTHHADMWVDAFPAADAHFYSNILHDWPPEKGRLLVEKSFAALEPGGRILIHEALFDDDKAGPPSVATLNMAIFPVTEGQQYSGRELTDLLANTGFQDVRITSACAPYSIVEGRKP